jgi:hypothetical protein
VSTAFKFVFTTHAEQRLIERAITKADCVEAATAYDSRAKLRNGNEGGIVYRLTKTVRKRELTVIAELVKAKCIFVTGYWK